MGYPQCKSGKLATHSGHGTPANTAIVCKQFPTKNMKLNRDQRKHTPEWHFVVNVAKCHQDCTSICFIRVRPVIAIILNFEHGVSTHPSNILSFYAIFIGIATQNGPVDNHNKWTGVTTRAQCVIKTKYQL